MQKLQDSVFSIVKTTNLSPAVFNFLQPTDDFPDKTPLGGILNDTKHGWLALGPKFCVVDLKTGLKVAQRTFGASLSSFRTTVTSVVELPTPLTSNSQQLIISLECEDIAGMICVFHINGSQVLRCMRTEVVITELAICESLPDGPFSCFDGAIMAGTKTGEVFVFDLNRSSLIQALKNLSQGYEDLIRGEENLAGIMFLPLNVVGQIEAQRELALENDDHIAVMLNENSTVDGQYIFRNPDGSVRMKAKKDHIRVTVVQYIPQLGSLAVGFNFGAFQIWNLLNLDLEFTSQVNVECLPVTHFGFQEPCDDPRAFCYLWVVFSVIDRYDEEEFPLAVMYSLTYQGKRMLSDTKCLYQEFLMATVRFQVELGTTEKESQVVGGRCVSCHTYSINSMLGAESEESMLNICQLVWECWGDSGNSSTQYGMMLFDLDQWYKDQMPATYQLQSNAFMSATLCTEMCRGATATLDARLVPSSVSVYCAATRLEEHFYPNSLRYDCIYLNTSEACVLSTTGIQRQIINSMDEVGPTALLNPTRLYHACLQTGLVPLYTDSSVNNDQEEQRRYLLSVALEARLSRFLKRCAHDWATGSHAGAGCTLTFLVDWCWKRALDLKENARELTAPLFTSSALPDRNVLRCLEYCVQQLVQLTQLLDAILTKCCNLVVPDALSSLECQYVGVGAVSLYYQVVQWFARAGLLPDRADGPRALSYPHHTLLNTYTKRRLKLHRVQDNSMGDDNAAKNPCSLLYIDQLIEQEFGGDRIRELWQAGGSECGGLYPPPSLYSLLRLYLLPDVAEEHKHSLVLYLLVDYSMVYDELRYEAVIRRLMQFPTMFGLSNTAIKATQAFWHLDHRDFDFALDQLQCLTGNTLSDWQHSVVLSSLLAQKKTQAALQYLHVRKPAPIHSASENNQKVSDHDKLEDWQSCCDLYLARGLVFEALDVVRMCVSNAGTLDDQAHVLNYFFKGCRNTGHLSKLLQASLSPTEEELFIRYLDSCNESQTSDILIMYYLQQARYLEAEQYNNRIKRTKQHRSKDLSTSIESLSDMMDRQSARDTLVEVVCSNLPSITNTVVSTALEKDFERHIIAPKPMSVFVQAKSPKNMFTYKSSFIQDTIENASETWINKPKARKGLKRALNIEETPFICTPKLSRSKTIFGMENISESTPPKRARLDLTGTPRTPKSAHKIPELSAQLSVLLDMPEMQSPDIKMYDRTGAETPHSILKIRENAMRDPTSPVDSRYLGESDDDILETASNHTHYSDSTNKHLRFTIPTASESGSTPSPPTVPVTKKETDISKELLKERDVDMSFDSFVTTQSHAMMEPHPLESPPKKLATEERVQARKTLKDSVRGRCSLSMSANSSLSEDPNTSIESIADIPITLINPRYSGDRRKSFTKDDDDVVPKNEEIASYSKAETSKSEVPTPKGRKAIRTVMDESTPIINRSRSATPERVDSPMKPSRSLRNIRSRSRTPETSPRSPVLEPILEQPKKESSSEPHPVKTTLSAPRALRSRSRTPERIEKVVESPRLEAITESPTKSSESPTSSPTRRNLRSRSRTPEVEIPEKPPSQGNLSPRSLRSRSKTPEKLMSPKKDLQKSAKKPLSRLVLEANAIAASKNLEKQMESEENTDSIIECTPMRNTKPGPSLMDVTFSPIVNKSILHSSNDSIFSESNVKGSKTSADDTKSIPAFTMNETKFGKSVLHSYESSVAEITHQDSKTKVDISVSKVEMKSLPAFTISESYFEKSVLHSYESSGAESSHQPDGSNIKDKDPVEKEIHLKSSLATTSFNVSNIEKSVLSSRESSVAEQDKFKSSKPNVSSLMTSDSEIEEWKAEKRDKQDVIQKEKQKIVEIEREIHEIENEMSEEGDDDDEVSTNASDGMVVDTDAEDSGEESDGESDNTIDDEEDNVDDEEEDDDDDVEDESELNNLLNVVKDLMCEGQMEIYVRQLNAESSNSIISIEDSDDQSSGEIKKDDNRGILDKALIEDGSNSNNTIEKTKESSTDPLNQAQVSLLTDDNSMHSDRSDDLLAVIESNIQNDKEEVQPAVTETIEPEPPVKIQIEVEVEPSFETVQKDITNDVVGENMDTVEITKHPQDSLDDISIVNKPSENITSQTKLALESHKTNDKPDMVDTEMKEAPKVDTEPQKENQSKLIDERQKIDPKTDPTTETTTTEPKMEETTTVAKEIEESSDKKDKNEVKKPASRTRRTRSTTSNKSNTESQQIEIDQTPPRTRKRSQSITSNNSITEEKTPEKEEEMTTPSRRRAKTPTSTQVRKILTRRASKEISEKLDDSQDSIDTSIDFLTPRRRSTRSRSKIEDDNASVASESSVKSSRSKMSEEAGDAKSKRGRKSVLPTKPDLSVIPEVTAEESSSKLETKEEIISNYSIRLTRHQKSLLESWLASPRKGQRRTSAASMTSIPEQSHDEDDVSSNHSSAFDVQPIDRISLLNKEEFHGFPDPAEEQSNISAGSIESDATSSKERRRFSRANSEAKATHTLKAAKVTRRTSVPSNVELSSPSRARSRRASFNRACEALHTPKGRRASTDLRKGDSDSQPGSPVASVECDVITGTPTRRARRISSASNTSATKSDVSTRGRKLQ